MQIGRFAEIPSMAWRNGGGVTRELLRIPATGHHDFLARVSIADVDTSGPFSAFPGVDRIIMLLDGSAMRLRLPTETVTLRQHVPFPFDGGLPVTGDIDSPTRDLNVMTLRGAATATMRVQPDDESGLLGEDGTHAIAVSLADGTTAALPGAPSTPTRLGQWDYVITADTDRAVITGAAAIITIT